MITEEQAREMAKEIYKSENAGRPKGKAGICICGYSGMSDAEEVICCKCGIKVYRDRKMKDYYLPKAKMYCAKCFLKTKYKKTALEIDILTKAQSAWERKNAEV